MFKRLFLEVPLTQEIKNKLFEYQCTLNNKEIKLVIKKNLHITLCFLGNIKINNTEELINLLSDIYKKIQKFYLEFDNIILAPNHYNPIMIWAKFKNNNNYKNLYKQTYSIAKKFMQTNIIKHYKEPVPHVTLARFKNLKNVNILNLSKPKIPKLYISSLNLLESKLQLNGSIYSIVKTFYLEP